MSRVFTLPPRKNARIRVCAAASTSNAITCGTLRQRASCREGPSTGGGRSRSRSGRTPREGTTGEVGRERDQQVKTWTQGELFLSCCFPRTVAASAMLTPSACSQDDRSQVNESSDADVFCGNYRQQLICRKKGRKAVYSRRAPRAPRHRPMARRSARHRRDSERRGGGSDAALANPGRSRVEGGGHVEEEEGEDNEAEHDFLADSSCWRRREGAGSRNESQVPTGQAEQVAGRNGGQAYRKDMRADRDAQAKAFAGDP